MQDVRVQSLVGEQTSHMPNGEALKKKKKKNKGTYEERARRNGVAPLFETVKCGYLSRVTATRAFTVKISVSPYKPGRERKDG